MIDIIILPGIGNSDNEHWQSHWQMQYPAMRRFRPANWEQPDPEDWIMALDEAVAAAAEPPLLVAHSLACLLVAHWAARSHRAVSGAVLVGVPDPSSTAFPDAAAGFAPVPAKTLPFPSLVIASSNDPFATPGYARSRAADWGSGFVLAGAFGHINSKSGLGTWPYGLALLAAFAAGLRIPLAVSP